MATRIGALGSLGANISARAADCNPVHLYGLGNGLYSAGRAVEAAEMYVKLVRLHRSSIAGLNNLAHVLAELGCREESMEALRRAQELSGEEGRFTRSLAETAELIQRLPAEGECPSPGIYP